MTEDDSLDIAVKSLDDTPYSTGKIMCCPICRANIDKEHYMFVVETMMDPQKMREWTLKKWTFEMWKELRASKKGRRL